MSLGKVPEPALARRFSDQERVLRVDFDLFLHHLPHGSAQSLSDAKLPLLQYVFEDLVLLLFQGGLDYLRHRFSQMMNCWDSFKRVLHEWPEGFHGASDNPAFSTAQSDVLGT